MALTRPLSDLINNTGEISEFCQNHREPVFLTQNGIEDLVIMSLETYKQQQSLLELYTRLAEAETEIAEGAEGEDFSQVAHKLRNSILSGEKVYYFTKTTE